MKLFQLNWQIAYRKKPIGTILSDNDTPFVLVPNTKRYVAADPFLFNYKGNKYLFAELYDIKDRRGKLGYAIWKGERFGDWHIVIEEEYHLSYPNIFEYNGDVFIIPESSACSQIDVYRASSFPNKWEKCATLLYNKKCVDTTFLSLNGKHWLFTYEIIPEENKKLLMYEISETGIKNAKTISSDDATARCGGKFLFSKEDIYRVSQDCDGEYGKAVVFSKVLECNKNSYKEHVYKKITTKDININGITNAPHMHTYNADEDLEVIDVHVPDYSIRTQLSRISKKVRKR